MPELTPDSPTTPPTDQAPEDAGVTARARFFVRLVQGTMALEGQALDVTGERQLLEQAERLLADPRPVWGER